MNKNLVINASPVILLGKADLLKTKNNKSISHNVDNT